MTSSDAFSRALDALSDPYRRQLLLALLEQNPQDDDDTDPLDIVAEDEQDAQSLQTSMVHGHLPKLAEAEFIEWDRQNGEIHTGPRWDEIAPLLGLIDAHRDDLPDGWL